MTDITPEDITGRDNPVGNYLYELERPGGILDRDAKEVQEWVHYLTQVESERDELLALIDGYAMVSQLYGETASDMQHIEVLREIYSDPYLLAEEYDLLADRSEMLKPQFDESPDGLTFTTWKAMWVRSREMTDNEYAYQMLSQAASGYAQARENLGHNLASLRQFQVLRDMQQADQD